MKRETTSLQSSAPNRRPPHEGIRPEDHDDIIAFLDVCQARGLARRTVELYGKSAEAFAEYTAGLGMPTLAQVRREHVESWLGALRARGNAPGTVRLRAAALRAMFTWMEQADVRRDHPMERLTLAPAPEQVMPDYSEGDVLAVLGAIPVKGATLLDLRDRSAILMLYDSGARSQELCDITIGDINREARHARIVSGKGAKGRLVAFSAETSVSLNMYIRRRGGWDGLGRTAPLFANKTGRALATNALRMMLSRRFRAAGLQFSGTHAFRRGWAQAFLEAGGDPTDLKELAGWSSFSMLYRYTKRSAQERALRAHEAFSPVARMMQKERK